MKIVFLGTTGNVGESLGGSTPLAGTNGLYPTRAELVDALTRTIKAGITYARWRFRSRGE